MELSNVNIVFSIIVGFIVITGSIFGFHKYIQLLIKKAVNDTNVLKKIASNLRPLVIFDDNGSIISDLGAMDLIEKIEVEKNRDGLPQRIVITPKIHFKQAPLLISLDSDNHTINITQGNKFEWIYTFEFNGYVDRDERSFRLEILL